MSRRTLRERLALRLPPVMARVNALLLRVTPPRVRHAAIAEAVRLQYAAFGRRDWDVILMFLDPQLELRTAHDAGHVFGADLEGSYHGHAGWLRYNERWLEPWSAVRVVPDEVIDTRDHVLVLGRVMARGRRSGLEVDNRFATLSRLRGGRVVEMDVFLDWEAARAAMAEREGGPAGAGHGRRRRGRTRS